MRHNVENQQLRLLQYYNYCCESILF
jgi:hypothetical protein